MKYIYYFFLSVIFVNVIFSQATITNQNNPVIGDIQYDVRCDTNANPGGSGANQTWNFTSVVRADSVVIRWVDKSSTPQGSLFPLANIASNENNANYNYYNASSTQLLLYGSVTTQFTAPLTDAEKLFDYPFTYPNSFTDNFTGTVTVSGFPGTRNGTINASADGWGTINLPFGSFTNALRVKYVVSIRDTTTILPIGVRTNQTIYQWYVPGKKFPVFAISTTQILLNGAQQSYVKIVSYNPLSPPIGIIQLGTNVPQKYNLEQNYPNPFNPVTKIRFDVPKSGDVYTSSVKLTIYDAAGKEAEVLVNQALSPGSYEADWNAEKFASGVYYYRIEAGNFIGTRKMILVK